MALSVPQSIKAAYDVQALREAEFPISRESVYMNHAGVSPVPRRSADAMRQVVEYLLMDPAAAFGASFMKTDHACRESFRALINAQSADEIVLVQSTSLALNYLATAIPWVSGQNVVLCDVEFPSNVYPWMKLAERGVETRIIPARDGGLTPDAVADAIDGQTRVVTVSAVQFFTGHRSDLAALGALCRERGILFVVDAIQAVGHMAIDVQGMNIAALASGGQKSLMGPPGQGFLYVRGDLIPDLSPAFLSAASVVDYLHWLQYKLTPLPGAARFNTGTPNIVGTAGLLASLSLLHELGVSNIDAYTTALAGYAVDSLRARGYEVITPAAHGPIVTFRAAPDDATTSALVSGLAARRFFVVKHWDRQGNAYIRVSLHGYNTPDEIDRFLVALKEVGSQP
ncbi:MAG: aminotransferase class V-fold PLP-dependent enzyme [Anaerolineae bacterium]|nr:aminotransferase class V-fold PLP-dependent enzyme [Anaerolineae bacterium]